MVLVSTTFAFAILCGACLPVLRRLPPPWAGVALAGILLVALPIGSVIYRSVEST